MVGGRSSLRPPSFVLPPSDEGGGKPEGFDGGRDTASLRKAGCPEQMDCEFSPSVACGDSSLDRGSQAPRGTKASSEEKRSPAADAGLGYCRSHPLSERTGGPGGISPLVKRPPGGLSVHFPPVESGRFPRKTGFAGAPIDLTALVAGKTGSLRHDGGTGRRFLKTGAKKGPCGPLFFYLAESVGFEPTVLAHAGFQDRCLQPLGQLSG